MLRLSGKTVYQARSCQSLQSLVTDLMSVTIHTVAVGAACFRFQLQLVVCIISHVTNSSCTELLMHGESITTLFPSLLTTEQGPSTYDVESLLFCICFTSTLLLGHKVDSAICLRSIKPFLSSHSFCLSCTSSNRLISFNSGSLVLGSLASCQERALLG